MFTFQVKVLGEPLGNLGTLMIDFEWPFAVSNGKWLLYLTEIVIKGATESRCVPPGKIVNHLNLTVSLRKWIEQHTVTRFQFHSLHSVVISSSCQIEVLNDLRERWALRIPMQKLLLKSWHLVKCPIFW